MDWRPLARLQSTHTNHRSLRCTSCSQIRNWSEDLDDNEELDDDDWPDKDIASDGSIWSEACDEQAMTLDTFVSVSSQGAGEVAGSMANVLFPRENSGQASRGLASAPPVPES